jgi:predicted DNA-binding protein with PD1-like motif
VRQVWAIRADAFRLTPGTDLRAELERLTGLLGLRAGCIVSCAGSLSQARLRMAGAAGEAEVFAARRVPCVGGRLVQGCVVNTTAELVIGELPELEFHRQPDPVTGYNELSVQPRPSQGEPSLSEPPMRQRP